MKKTFILAHQTARNGAIEAVRNAPDGFAVTISEPTRSLDQNARLWASLTEVSKQVDWYGKKLTPEDWKILFTAALKKYEIVPGIDGGFVAIGQSTSKMTKKELSDLLEVIYCFGANNGVSFNDQND